MTRIIFLRSSNDVGGVEKQVLHIAGGLYRSGILESILVTRADDSDFARAFKELGLPVVALPELDGPILRAAGKLDRLVDEYGAKAVQSHMFRESIIARAVKLRRKELVHVARLHTYIDCSWIPEWRKQVYHLLEKLTERGVDRYLPITMIAGQEMERRSRISPGKISIVPDGVPQLGTPDPSNQSDETLPCRIAMVAHFIPHKGHDVLIRSLAVLKNRGLRLQVRLIGGDFGKKTQPLETSGQIKDLAGKSGVLDMLEFSGSTNDVYQAIRDYPVVVLPSDSEGLPNSILEAMSIRKIVIASKVGGVPEIIKNRVNGFVHRAQDPMELADILGRIFAGPARSWEGMRNSALQTWQDNYSTGIMLRNLTGIYRELGIAA
jgi:glycosyltransferase involved in cell wall biosynthesis